MVATTKDWDHCLEYALIILSHSEAHETIVVYRKSAPRKCVPWLCMMMAYCHHATRDACDSTSLEQKHHINTNGYIVL